MLVPIGLALHIWNVGRHGLGAAELARVAAWPPEWWSMWWPASLRRPSDVWPRLPFPAWMVRVTLSAFFFFIPALILSRQWLSRSGWTPSDDWHAFQSAQSAAIVITALVVIGAFAWAQRKDLSIGEAIRLLLGATAASPSWESPNIARVLRPSTGAVRPPDRDAPADHLRALEDLVAVIPRSEATRDLHLLFHDAADAARAAVGKLKEYDAELATLSRDASPAEIDRLSAQLATFGDPNQGNAERRELRDLVVSQLELVRRLRARHEELARERARLLDLLRGLWAQCLDARSGSGSDGRLRATLAELRRPG